MTDSSVVPPESSGPKPPILKRPWILGPTCGLLGLAVGIGIGAASASSDGSQPKASASDVSKTTTPPHVTHSTKPTHTPSTPTYVPPPTPAPSASYSRTCDYVLGNFTSHTARGFRFVAQSNVKNTGNVGISVDVTATWQQTGTAPITMTKTVKVPYNQSRTANMTVEVGQDNIDLIQSQPYGHDCSVKAKITKTFGKTH